MIDHLRNGFSVVLLMMRRTQDAFYQVKFIFWIQLYVGVYYIFWWENDTFRHLVYHIVTGLLSSAAIESKAAVWMILSHPQHISGCCLFIVFLMRNNSAVCHGYCICFPWLLPNHDCFIMSVATCYFHSRQLIMEITTLKALGKPTSIQFLFLSSKQVLGLCHKTAFD